MQHFQNQTTLDFENIIKCVQQHFQKWWLSPYTIVLSLLFVAAGLNKQRMEHFVSYAKYNVSFMSCKTQ